VGAGESCTAVNQEEKCLMSMCSTGTAVLEEGPHDCRVGGGRGLSLGSLLLTVSGSLP
jgi:hypothetical protein